MIRNREASEKARAYFRRPGFQRMLSLMWQRYERLERVGGQAVVEGATAEECEAINLFFGWDYKPGETIRVSLKKFEDELKDSAFPFCLKELHLLLEGTPLQTKSEKKMLQNTEWRRLFASVRGEYGTELPVFAAEWLQRLEEGFGQGCRTLKELFMINPVEAETALRHAVRALDILFMENSRLSVGGISLRTIRLPVLAAMVSGDSHALDWKQPAGRLLFYALRERQSDDHVPEDMENFGTVGHETMVSLASSHGLSLDKTVPSEVDTLAMREVYRSAGISDDDLSSLVYVYIPEPDKLPEPNVWTLRQVEAMEEFPRCSALYIVENPSVFSTLLDITEQWLRKEAGSRSLLSSAPPALLCTSGPASAAALRWIQRSLGYSGESCPIYYSGDFDVQGLTMGVTLAHRFPGHFVPWRFDTTLYCSIIANHPGPSFEPAALSNLTKLDIPWDVELTHEMTSYKMKLFQESFVSLLAQDWLQSCSSDDILESAGILTPDQAKEVRQEV